MQLIDEVGYHFRFNPSECEICGGHCCTGESGYIWMNYSEIEAMAAFINLSVEDFATMYLKKVNGKYSLREKKLSEENFACIFFDEQLQRCGVYPVRPKQCQTFPFWEEFKTNKEEVIKACPGIVF
jgi:Fe-S-cluster containining protein